MGKALAIAKNVIDSQKIENQNLEEENGRIIAEKTESLAKIKIFETEVSKLQAILKESEAKNHILESEKIENLKDIEELQLDHERRTAVINQMKIDFENSEKEIKNLSTIIVELRETLAKKEQTYEVEISKL